MFAASITFMTIILFSGGYYLESSVSWILRWMQYISPSYYARCALANNQFYGVQVNPDLSGNVVLDEKRALGLGLWGSIGALMGLFVIFFILAQIVFYFNIRNNTLRKINHHI